jgi:hypothetical protein
MPRSFYVLLVSPIVLMAISSALLAFWKNQIGAEPSMWITGVDYVVMLVSALICAVMVSSRKGAGVGVWTFVGLIALYGGVAFAGCAHFLEAMEH